MTLNTEASSHKVLLTAPHGSMVESGPIHTNAQGYRNLKGRRAEPALLLGRYVHSNSSRARAETGSDAGLVALRKGHHGTGETQAEEGSVVRRT